MSDLVRTVAVVGGNGKTGHAVAEALRARDVAVRPVGRAQAGGLVAALTGADALYLIAPNMHPDEPAFVGDVLVAARAAGVGRIGYHSVAAPYAPSMPHHLGKAVAEDVVRRGGLEWTILQPCAYVQNFVPALRSAEPALRVPYSPLARFGLVDLADVAEAAATVLLGDGHAGATYELGGPVPVSVADVGRAASQILGREVPVERVAIEDWRSGDGAGLEPRVRDWLAAMFAYYDAHGLSAGRLPLEALLGRRPTPLEETLRRETAGAYGPGGVASGSSCDAPAQD